MVINNSNKLIEQSPVDNEKEIITNSQSFIELDNMSSARGQRKPILANSNFFFGGRGPVLEERREQVESPKANKISKAISYFLNGDYDKILDAEEDGEGIDLDDLAAQRQTDDVQDWLDQNLSSMNRKQAMISDHKAKIAAEPQCSNESILAGIQSAQEIDSDEKELIIDDADFELEAALEGESHKF